MSFVSRESELALLDDLNQRSGAQFLVLYGRRRIGKTALITQWGGAIDAPYFYWMASQTSAINQLRNFSQALFQFLNPDTIVTSTFSYPSWDAAFAEVARLAAQRRVVIVLDEITYVMQANGELPSLIQKAWDHHLKDSQVFLILIGSMAGIMQRAALDYQSPLYGRATALLKLQPLTIGALVEMLPNYNSEERLAVYAITGGIPAYIELFDDTLSVLQNLQQRIVTPANVMLSDAVFLLHEQLDDPRNYIAILEAIAAGFHRLTEIATMSGVERSNIPKYLIVLRELGYVERQVPATEPRPENNRQGRYLSTDAYMRFYYRFLAPHRSAIEQGRVKQVVSLLYEDLLDFIGSHTFEELCRVWVGVSAEMAGLQFLPERIGSFWSSQTEVDVVAVSWRTKDILLGTCNWDQKAVGQEVVQTLVDKTEMVLPDHEKWQVHYVVFARSDFTPEAQALAQKHRVQLVTLEKLETDMQHWLKSHQQYS